MWIAFGIIYILIGIAYWVLGIIMLVAVAEYEGYEIELKCIKVFPLIYRTLLWPVWIIYDQLKAHREYDGGSITEYICKTCPGWTMEDEEP